jgi:hypothetical protein
MMTIPFEEVSSARFAALGPTGIGALVLLCAWSDGQWSNGIVPAEVAARLGVPKRVLGRLIELGELRNLGGSFEVVHFTRYCEPSETRRDRQRYERDRKRKQREGSEPAAPRSRPVFSGAVPWDSGRDTAPVPGPTPSHPKPSPSLPSLQTEPPPPDLRVNARASDRPMPNSQPSHDSDRRASVGADEEPKVLGPENESEMALEAAADSVRDQLIILSRSIDSLERCLAFAEEGERAEIETQITRKRRERQALLNQAKAA